MWVVDETWRNEAAVKSANASELSATKQRRTAITDLLEMVLTTVITSRAPTRDGQYSEMLHWCIDVINHNFMKSSGLMTALPFCKLANYFADDVRLYLRPMFEVLWWCVHACAHRCRLFAITISRPRWPRRPTRTVHSVWLAQFSRVRTNNLEQTSTGSAKHRQWHQGTVSTYVGLMGRYLSMHTAEGMSYRRWLKARRINGLTYLLTYLITKLLTYCMTQWQMNL